MKKGAAPGARKPPAAKKDDDEFRAFFRALRTEDVFGDANAAAAPSEAPPTVLQTYEALCFAQPLVSTSDLASLAERWKTSISAQRTLCIAERPLHPAFVQTVITECRRAMLLQRLV